MSPETEALLDTIAKLKAKAEGTTNQAEAELFAAKVAELLAKHNLNEAMLNARDADREAGPIGRHPFGSRVPDAWRERIVQGVAKLYFCRLVFNVSGRNQKVDQWSWTSIGREHNALVAQSMALWLIASVKRMAREYSPISAEQKNFRKGAGDRLWKRLYEMAMAMRAEQAGPSDGSALMIRTEDQALADYLGDVQEIKGKSHKHGHGSREGWDAAGSINLNTQIAETRTERMIGSK